MYKNSPLKLKFHVSLYLTSLISGQQPEIKTSTYLHVTQHFRVVSRNKKRSHPQCLGSACFCQQVCQIQSERILTLLYFKLLKFYPAIFNNDIHALILMLQETSRYLGSSTSLFRKTFTKWFTFALALALGDLEYSKGRRMKVSFF